MYVLVYAAMGHLASYQTSYLNICCNLIFSSYIYVCSFNDSTKYSDIKNMHKQNSHSLYHVYSAKY